MKRITILFLSLILLYCHSQNSYADKLYLGQLTDHIGKGAEDPRVNNEVHALIGYEFDNGWGVGYMHKNSYSKKSYLAGKSFSEKVTENLDMGFRVYVATGYEDFVDLPITLTFFANYKNIAINIAPNMYVGIGLVFDL